MRSRVRSIVEVRLEGKLQCPWVQAKDIILELLWRLSAGGGKNKVFEFTGPGTADLSIPERATIANMIADLGGTAGLFPPDENTREWLDPRIGARTSSRPDQTRGRTTTTGSRSTWTSWGRWSPSRTTPTTSSR
jgi:aconitase A